MVERDLPFKARTTQTLMEIASHPILSNTQYVAHLPPSWGTLYELTKLEEPVLLRKIEAGEITPKIERKAPLARLGRPWLPAQHAGLLRRADQGVRPEAVLHPSVERHLQPARRSPL
jgi:hypothetical protein